jgi:hypothetical protein
MQLHAWFATNPAFDKIPVSAAAICQPLKPEVRLQFFTAPSEAGEGTSLSLLSS